MRNQNELLTARGAEPERFVPPMEEAAEILEAIRNGEADALVARGPAGETVFTLRMSDHPYRVFFESMREGAATLTPDGVVLFSNRAFAELLGAAGALAGRRLQELLPEALRAECAAALRAGRAGEAECTGVLGAPGRERHGQFVFRPMELDGATMVALLVSDVTDRAHVAERTREAQHRLQQLKAVSRQLFQAEQTEQRRLATELHDYLAQILVVCKLKLSKLDRHLSDVRTADLFLEVRGLLDQALTYTRTLIAELSPLALEREGLLAALETLANKLRSLELEVALHCHGTPRELPRDQALLVYQSVRELLHNVMKHAQVPRAEVHCHWAADQVVLAVEDEGVGFDPGRLAQVPGSGSGFGLLSVRERIEALGGRFGLETMPGGGTRVRLELPAPPAAAEAAPAAPVAAPPGAPGHGVAMTQVLLVDDHRMVREGLRSIIDATPDLCVVGEAGDGLEGIEQAGRLLPHVVVLDNNMPRCTGVEAARVIKARHPEMLIIGISIFDDAEVRQAMCAAGAATLVAKSSAAQDLCKAIRQHVRVAPAGAAQQGRAVAG